MDTTFGKITMQATACLLRVIAQDEMEGILVDLLLGSASHAPRTLSRLHCGLGTHPPERIMSVNGGASTLHTNEWHNGEELGSRQSVLCVDVILTDSAHSIAISANSLRHAQNLAAPGGRLSLSSSCIHHCRTRIERTGHKCAPGHLQSPS